MTIVTLVSGCGNAHPGHGTGDGGGQGRAMGEQHANGWRVSRHRLVADAPVGVIASPMAGRDIRRLVASASVFPSAEKASMAVRLTAAAGSVLIR
jgi:hypothetical protein